MTSHEIATGELRNSLSRQDKTQYLRKQFKGKIYTTSVQHKYVLYDTTGIFRLDISLLDGPDVLGSSLSALPQTERIFNDNDQLITMFMNQSDFTSGTDWTFNFSAKTITTTTNTAVSEIFAKDSTKSWTNASVTLLNAPSGFETKYSLQLVTDSETKNVGWNGSVTFTGTTTLKYQIVNSGAGETLNMVDSKGVPMILKISYS